MQNDYEKIKKAIQKSDEKLAKHLISAFICDRPDGIHYAPTEEDTFLYL